MARPPIIQLSDVRIGQGKQDLFSDLNLVVNAGDRLALVGRNGAGKSTMLRVMSGSLPPDDGQISMPKGASVGILEQMPDFADFATLRDFALDGLPPSDFYRVEAASEGLGFDPDRAVAIASGGERRRAALARVLAEAPDLLLLDEPTNHLDITAILWLEERLRTYEGAVIAISHDRKFLSSVTEAVLWLDRGMVRRLNRNFEQFEGWRDKHWADEDDARHKLDRKIAAEAKWAVEGISARRKRNQGRLRALEALRNERRAAVSREGRPPISWQEGHKSGKLVIEAIDIAKSFDGIPLIRDFSLKVARGDRIAIAGPNGSGKTTLINMLTGKTKPDSGTLRHGVSLNLAMYDQNRDALDPSASLWDTLTADPLLKVGGRSDQVMVQGSPRHVVGYLKEFLFSEEQARARVESLSGGEKARLLLARLMAQPANLLVLDEPTNDLDVETLDVLEEALAHFPGTVLLVSHDRDFIDRVANMTLVFEGHGLITPFIGGIPDGAFAVHDGAKAEKKQRKERAKTKDPKKGQRTGLSFTEDHRLRALPDEIAVLEGEIAKLQQFLAIPDIYESQPDKFTRATAALSERAAKLAAAEEEWLRLAEIAEKSGD